MSYAKYQVTLTFGGEHCPMLPSRSFVVQATGIDSARAIAIYDAVALGYKESWVVGYSVEVL